MTIDVRKLAVLLEVLQRAPVSAAEQLICEEVVAVLVQLAEPPAPPPTSEAERIAGDSITTPPSPNSYPRR